MIGEFVAAMRQNVPEEARIMLCQFRGDPGDDIKGKWRAYVLNDTEMIDQYANVYLCVSAMKRNARGEFRRRKENFAGGLLLMIDDLGTGPGSKFPLSLVKPLPPSALIETSPDNFQAVYLFEELVTDLARFEALIRAFIDRQFLGRDTGMAGVNRVFRPPAGVNGKPKHGGWRVRLRDWYPERRYSVQALVSAFGLDLSTADRSGWPRKVLNERSPEKVRHFVQVRAELRAAGMLKGADADLGGWQDVRCPWTDEHTGRVDNGAAIAEPSPENDWFGGFRCHHGSCEGRGWRELTEWLAEDQAAWLDHINKNAQGGIDGYR
jgi:hypothetical protein